MSNISRPSLLNRARNIAPIALGLLLFMVGVFALYRLLSHVNFHDVVRNARAMPPARLAMAFGTTALGYMALIGYDWSALRYLGRRIPARIVAIGGFLGYSFGNTIGISALSGGAVRYRIYSAFGLNAFEVAAVSTFVALAFGLGITVVGLTALVIHPLALGGMLPWSGQTTRIAAGAGLVALIGVMSWLSVTGKVLKIKSFEIAAPSPGILFGQLLITAADTTMAALTLYILLPAGAPDFVTFLAIFSVAVMAGVLSHVPGGIGVFETLILVSMPAAVPVEQAAAALVLYRIIYYLVPFALALIVVATNEARLAGGYLGRHLGAASDQMEPVLKAVSAITPAVTGVTAFGLGVYMLLMALVPSVRPGDINPGDLLAAVLLEGGSMLSALLGVVLILLAQGLYRRISGAFWLTEASLLAGVAASLLNRLDVESALLLAAAALVLSPLRAEFYRSAKITQNLLSPRWLALIAGLVFAAGAFLFLLHEATPYTLSLWTDFSGAANTPRALRAALAASALLTVVLVYLALQPAGGHSRSADAPALDKAREIILGQDDPEAWLALSGDKSLFFSGAEDAFIMYATQGRSWVAYADPVGPEDAGRDLAWAFFDAAYAANARPVFYEVSTTYLSLWVEMGMSLHKLGEEAVVRLGDWSLAGGKFKSMRAAHNKALKSGLGIELLQPPHAPELWTELQQVSDAWLGEKTGREKRFSVGRFRPDYLAGFPIAVVRREGRILAFTNVLVGGDGKRISIDLMRYLPAEANGMMEFLFVELLAHFRDLGAAEFSLGVAPLSGIEARRGTRLWNRFGALLFRHGSGFYNFAGLRAFKQKFQPEWRPHFLAIPAGVSPLVALKDVAILIAGGAKGLFSK